MALAATAIVVSIIGFSHHAFAIWEPITPDSGNTVLTTVGNPVSPLTGGTASNRVYHVIKKEATSQVLFTEFDVYFSELGTGHYIELTDRINNTNRCGVWWSGVGPFVTVTMTIQDPVNPLMPAAQRTATFNIPEANICSPAATGGTNARGTNNGRFFARYPVPLGFAAGLVNRDADTSLYNIKMRIAYSNPAAVPPGGSGGPNQQILFKAQTDTAVPATCNSATCDRYIGAAAATSGGTTPNVATLGDTNDGNTGVYTQQRVYFGLPCTTNTAIRKRITVYDLDNGSTGGSWGNAAEASGQNRARFFIQSSPNGVTWTSLDATDYLLRQDTGGGPTTTTPISVMGGIDTLLPKDGSAITTNVEFIMQPRTHYRIIVSPLYSNNIINLGLPVGSRTIFGVLNCNVRVAGSIATTPAAGVDPIEAGRRLTMTAQSVRSGNTDFTSSYNYNFRVWYDTGDNVYNAVDDGGLLCNQGSDITDTNASGVTRTLNNCSNILADPSARGGRATAICSQLVLTRLATDSVTQVTTGAPPNGVIRCFRIGKYPHLEARNGDVFAGGRLASASPTCTFTPGTTPIISSSQRQPDGVGPYYTSYATYGVTSLGEALTFGSMGVSYEDIGAVPSTISDNLVFANTSTVDGFFYNATGNNATPTTPHCLNDPFAIFGPRATTNVPGTSIDISSPGFPDNANLTGAGTIDLYASAPIPPGKKIVIYAKSANIKISSNITYADQAYGSIDQIPQIVILTDRDLIVRQDAVTGGQVTQLDGIYAAKNNFFTCDVVPRLHLCEVPLQINGAVIAGEHVIPLRTAGADAANYAAMAETFNLRSDMLINQLPDAGSPSTFIQTLSETEVPPRF